MRIIIDDVWLSSMLTAGLQPPCIHFFLLSISGETYSEDCSSRLCQSSFSNFDLICSYLDLLESGILQQHEQGSPLY